MSRRRSDESFVGFAAAHRPRLTGAAVLLGATPAQAEAVVEWALAESYPGWAAALRPDLEVARRVLTTEAGSVDLPWRRGPRVALVDGTTAGGPAALRRLTHRQRVLVVGRHQLGLSTADLSAATGIDPLVLSSELEAAERATGVSDLAVQLSSATYPGSAPTDDLAHGRWVQRRRRSRVLMAAAAVLAVLAVLGWQVRPTPAPTSAPVPVPVLDPTTPTPSPSAAPCPTTVDRCQVQATRAWRAQTATIVATALDPDGTYFTGGFSYGYDERYDGGGYWSGRDGALGLNLLSVDGGATQVFVQISTNRSAGVRCGELTGHRCDRQKFLDGNWFTLTETVDAVHGMEVQYRPDGDQVITLVAWTSSKGKRFDVQRADLISVIQDPRMRLPTR